MKTRYYKPNISEFYVGFEYEWSEYEWSEYDRKIWINEKADMDDVLLAYTTYEESPEEYLNEYRVKYLNKEDIESLGFKFDKTSIDTQLKFFKDNLCLFYRPKTNELGTFTIDPSKNEYISKYMRDNKMISFLIIKNKSELKVLLKQLNILDE